MAFAFTLQKKEVVEGGYVIEQGTWTADGGTTTGNITVDTATQPEIIKITQWNVSSNGDTQVYVAQDVADTTLKLTFAANDSGKFLIKGKCA